MLKCPELLGQDVIHMLVTWGAKVLFTLNRLVGWLVGCLVGGWVGWLVGCLVGWLVLVGCC